MAHLRSIGRRRVPWWRAAALAVGVAALAWAGGPALILATVNHGGMEDGVALPEREEPIGPPDPEAVRLLAEPGAFAEAKRTFTVYCTGCHGLFAGGGAGPSLTDSKTLYGGRFQDILNIVTNGSPNRPMPAWKEKLPPERIRLVAAYVYSIRGTRASTLPDSPSWHMLLAPGLWLPGR